MFTQALIRELVEFIKPRSVLQIGGTQSYAAILMSEAAEYVWVGGEPKSIDLSRPELKSFRCLRGKDVLSDLAQISTGFCADLVFIDHDHGIEAVIDQINAASAYATGKTIWILDDAVPQDLDMASERPVPGKWWVGSVWAIVSTAWWRSSRAHLCIDTKPTGVAVALGLPLRGSENAAIEARNLVKECESIDWIRNSIGVCESSGLERFKFECRNNTHIRVRVADSTAYEQITVLPPEGYVEQQREIIKPMPILMADFSNGLVKHKFHGAIKERIPSARLCSLKDVHLIGPQLLIDTKEEDDCGGYVYARWSLSAVQIVEESLKKESVFEKWNGGYWVRRPDSDSIELSGRYILATPDEPRNWGMWLLLVIPAVHQFLRARDLYDGVICFCEFPWQKNFLHYLGVSDDELVNHDLKIAYKIEQLDWTVRGYRNLAVSQREKEAFHELVSKELGDDLRLQRNDRKLFLSRLSRSRRGSYRPLLNEEEVISMVRQLGFDVVEPELLSFPEQIRLFHDASVVVGLGGAGMFNAVFCRPGTKVVTIESSSNWVHGHTNLFHSLGLEYGVCFGREDLSDPRASHRRWSIDVDGLERALRPLVS